MKNLRPCKEYKGGKYMRRISAKHAKPTMMLGRAIFDSYGRMIFKEGTKLSAQQVQGLDELGVGELFILDKRVDDIPAWPLITPELEGTTSSTLRQIVIKAQTIVSRGKAQLLDITPLRQKVFEMVQQLFPVAMGEPVIGGCYSVKDYDYVHPVKVASISLLIGKATGMGQTALINLGVASLLQNIGYVAIPQGILDKAGTPTKGESQVIQKHSLLGAEILRRYAQADPEIALIVQQHHERWNGSGYPDHYAGRNICHGARIIALTDSAVALVSKRPHRGCILPKEATEFIDAFTGDLAKADFLKPHQAMEFIVAYSGELFDPDLVKIFTRTLPTYPSGIMVRLNTGEVGIVTNANAGYFARPKVRICYDTNLRDVAKAYDINLADAEHQQSLITEVMEY
jgi:HD-GYP domain-containing protein (c-di-GMP phosphodiesterase class II)